MELSEIRTQIDAVDDQLLNLFLERMASLRLLYHKRCCEILQ